MSALLVKRALSLTGFLPPPRKFLTFLKVLHVVSKCLRVPVKKFVSWIWADGGRKGVTSLSQNNGT